MKTFYYREITFFAASKFCLQIDSLLHSVHLSNHLGKGYRLLLPFEDATEWLRAACAASPPSALLLVVLIIDYEDL